MKLTKYDLKRLIVESLNNNIIFKKLDSLYNGSSEDIAQLKMILQSRVEGGNAWLNSKINVLRAEIEKINKEINRLENLPFDPYYDDVIKMEINDFQYDAALAYKQLAYLKSLNEL